jgi:hypothetical protein
MSLQVAERDAKGKQKISINLTEEAATIVRGIAERKGITVSEVLRRAIGLEQFIVEQLDKGATLMLTHDDGKTLERVHFVF